MNIRDIIKPINRRGLIIAAVIGAVYAVLLIAAAVFLGPSDFDCGSRGDITDQNCVNVLAPYQEKFSQLDDWRQTTFIGNVILFPLSVIESSDAFFGEVIIISFPLFSVLVSLIVSGCVFGVVYSLGVIIISKIRREPPHPDGLTL